MPDPQANPQIQGLPPGAIAVPIQQTQAAPATPQIKGLPPGAKLVPINPGYSGDMTSTGIAAPQGTGTLSEGWNSLKKSASDLATGATQGAANTVGSSTAGIAKLIRKIPFLGPAIEPEQGINSLEARTQQASAPANTTQAVGKGAEQIGEFLLPGAGEEDTVAHALPWLSKLGRAAKPIARIGYQAGTQGLVNAAQGGSPTTGALSGAVGGTLGEGMRAVAPALAESALGITKRMRGYGKTPGVAALEETTGLMPATVERSAQQKLGQLTQQVNDAADTQSSFAPQPRPAAPLQPSTPVSLHPALNVIDAEIAKATAQNNAAAIEQLGRVRSALTDTAGTGAPIATDQTPRGALDLKRGLRSQFVRNWNPELMQGTKAVAARASGAIDSGLDSALGPQFADANQRVSSLIPVAERSESLERDPSLAQKIGNRMAAHTGALAASVGLGYGGYQRGGIKGALGGALTGLVLPEILESPGVKMLAARTAFSPGALVRLLNGSGLQFDRPSDQ